MARLSLLEGPRAKLSDSRNVDLVFEDGVNPDLDDLDRLPLFGALRVRMHGYATSRLKGNTIVVIHTSGID